MPSRTGIKAEDHVKLALDTNKIHVFDAETEEIICHYKKFRGGNHDEGKKQWGPDAYFFAAF